MRIRREVEIERSTDERAFVLQAQQRAHEAWRDYLRAQGLPPYPAIDAAIAEPVDIELHFHIRQT